MTSGKKVGSAFLFLRDYGYIWPVMAGQGFQNAK